MKLLITAALMSAGIMAPMRHPAQEGPEIQGAICSPKLNQSSTLAVSLKAGIVSLNALEYHLEIGSWDVLNDNGCVTYTPTGSELHALEICLKGSATPLVIDVQAEGVVIVTKHHVLVSTNQKQGIVLDKSLYIEGGLCDGSYSGVISWVASGDCWGTLTSNPETGTWEQKCNLNNNQECTGTLTYSSEGGTTTKNPVWPCTGMQDKKISGNSSAGQRTAFINNASSGC